MRLLPLAVAALVLMMIGPDKLQHFHLWQRLALVGGVVVAFGLSIAIGRRSSNANTDSVRKVVFIQYALVFWRVMTISSVCAAVVGVIAVVLFRNAFPVRYLILAPIANLILAALFYRAARTVKSRLA
jgi:multisubunit Na+/H+ antiporter MnhE subunit